MLLSIILACIIAILGVIIAVLIRMLRIQKRMAKQLKDGSPEAFPVPAETVDAIAMTALREENGALQENNGRLARMLEEERNARAGDLDRMAQQAEKEIAQRVSDARRELDLEFAERKRTDRQISNRLSRGALLAKVIEHVGPMVPGFPYNLKECRHVGEIFDYLVYDGMEAGEPVTVIFLEVKSSATGRKRRVTNPRERALRDAIQAGRVKYVVWQPPTDDQLTERLTDTMQQILDGAERSAIEPPLDNNPADG